ncbi:hypothetical protein VULLAG_LOCUS23279 [Vulpes lagopus]
MSAEGRGPGRRPRSGDWDVSRGEGGRVWGAVGGGRGLGRASLSRAGTSAEGRGRAECARSRAGTSAEGQGGAGARPARGGAGRGRAGPGRVRAPPPGRDVGRGAGPGPGRGRRGAGRGQSADGGRKRRPQTFRVGPSVRPASAGWRLASVRRDWASRGAGSCRLPAGGCAGQLQLFFLTSWTVREWGDPEEVRWWLNS